MAANLALVEPARPAPVLRPYQVDMVARVEAERLAGRRRILLVLVTGGGKTVVIADIIAAARARGERVLVLAHRRELITQTSQKLYAVGVGHGIVQAGFPSRPGEAVQVASIQTLHARAIRSAKMDLPPADLVVVDEAHHARSESYQRIVASYPAATLIGMTATPCRGDGRGLGNTFQVIVEGPPAADLIRDGFLVGTRVYAPARPDLRGVHTRAGDYVETELAERMDKPKLVGDIVSTWLRIGERRPTVVFATGVSHSVHLRDSFRAAGVAAEHIDGSTPIEQRDAILADLKAGRVDVVCNAMVLTEGWDCPEVSCLVLARPTKSIGLHRQMIGRVLRPAPSKIDALILDHAGAVFAHGFAEDAITWTLEEDQRAENKVHAARGQAHRSTLTTCPECHAVRFEGKACGECGWRPQPKPRAVDVIDGDLGRVDRSRRVHAHVDGPDARLDFYRQLLWIADEREYQRGWAAHQFKAKFGTWPPFQSVDPMAPEPATRSWIRSRQIAYARARQAGAGAAA
jgi:superfamily II DNA or RNA helicase